MRFALFPNVKKPHSVETAKKVKEWLIERGQTPLAEEEKALILGVETIESVPPSSIDFLVSFGGDGTILRALHRNPLLNAPIIGVNLGSLGFMADIPLDELFSSFENILKGNFTIQERIVIEGKMKNGTPSFAVNEVVIHRGEIPSLIDLSIELGGQYVNSFSADGLIISTPNGSTAYSLSAGGPILTPDLSALVITPICPHTISNRPIVVGSEQVISVKYISHYMPVEVIYDGFPLQNLSQGEEVELTISEKTFKLVSFPHHNFFSTLRTKLGWTGRLKSPS